jgi:GTPase SAR1 family protein
MNRQIDDIRERILNYEVMPNRNTQRFNYDDMPDHIDILLFGPAGAGKTSLIKTFYRALHLHHTIPENVQELLTVKSKNQNEGTTRFTKVVLKPYDAPLEEQVKEKKKKGIKDQAYL